MDANLSGDRSTRSPSHHHDWQPIEGWFARYRCKICFAVGYRPRLVTAELEGGPYGTMRTIPYVCGVVRCGKRCGRAAIVKRKNVWRCSAHFIRKPGPSEAALRSRKEEQRDAKIQIEAATCHKERENV